MQQVDGSIAATYVLYVYNIYAYIIIIYVF